MWDWKETKEVQTKCKRSGWNWGSGYQIQTVCIRITHLINVKRNKKKEDNNWSTVFCEKIFPSERLIFNLISPHNIKSAADRTVCMLVSQRGDYTGFKGLTFYLLIFKSEKNQLSTFLKKNKMSIKFLCVSFLFVISLKTNFSIEPDLTYEAHTRLHTRGQQGAHTLRAMGSPILATALGWAGRKLGVFSLGIRNRQPSDHKSGSRTIRPRLLVKHWVVLSRLCYTSDLL